jgi:predicted SnoaL-like aldol condensation-catalyzing enzyme
MSSAISMVTAYMQNVWVNQNADSVDKYISDKEFIQHSCNLENGREALKKFLPYLFGTIMPAGKQEL